MDNRAIGVFDSGLGGLTAVKELRRLMPEEDIVYFGDTGRVPYGSRSRETIIKYAQQDAAFLKSKQVKMIIAACGTVSSVAADVLASQDLPFTGVLRPTALAAAEDLSGTGEQCFMLGHLKDPDISLYGVAGEDVVLLRRGETLAAFEQVYRAQPQAVLPELWWMDLDGDGAEELAVRYLRDADEDHLVYDLHIYAWDGQRWSDCAVTKDACADRVLSQVEVRRENGSVTLSYGRTSAVYQLPQGSGAGRLVLDSGFFRCQDGVFTVVLGARVDQLSHFANVLADIDYAGGSFTLRNLRVEPTMGV